MLSSWRAIAAAPLPSPWRYVCITCRAQDRCVKCATFTFSFVLSSSTGSGRPSRANTVPRTRPFTLINTYIHTCMHFRPFVHLSRGQCSSRYAAVFRCCTSQRRDEQLLCAGADRSQGMDGSRIATPSPSRCIRYRRAHVRTAVCSMFCVDLHNIGFGESALKVKLFLFSASVSPRPT